VVDDLVEVLEPAHREFFIDNLLVRIQFIIVMIRWTGLAPWEFECGGYHMSAFSYWKSEPMRNMTFFVPVERPLSSGERTSTTNHKRDGPCRAPTPRYLLALPD